MAIITVTDEDDTVIVEIDDVPDIIVLEEAVPIVITADL